MQNTKAFGCVVVACGALSSGISKPATAQSTVNDAVVEAASTAAPAPDPTGNARIQNAASDATEGNWGEIVVTAQRRADSVQEVPISIAAFSGADLAAKGITTTKDLQMVVPSLSVTSFNGFATPYIRGVGKNIIGPMAESPVAFYIDGVYISSPYSMLSSLSDIERVEVLRGPQGTLYGRNSTGGAINLITRDPSQDLAADASISYGNLDAVEAKAYLSGGSDKVSASIAGMYNRRDGYMINRVDGEDLDNVNRYGGRAKVKLEPTERVTVTFSADYSRSQDRSGMAVTSLSERPLGLLFGGRAGQSPRETYLDTTGAADNRLKITTGGESVNIRADLGALDLVSISAHRYTKIHSALDVDGTDAFVSTAYAPKTRTRTYSQELQLVSNSSGPLEWIVGAYLFDIKGGFDLLEVYAPPSATVPAVQVNSVLSSHATAGFVQVGYRFDDNWKLTLGGRYSHEKIKRKRVETYIPELDLLIPDPGASKAFNSFDPKVTLEYHFEDSMLYATASTGFKSGAFSDSAVGAPISPEEIKAVEAGGKHTLARGIYLNWAGFYYWYDNLQVTISRGFDAVLENAAKAKIYGAEVDLNARVTRDLNVTLSASLLSAKYSDYPDGAVYIPNPANGGYGYINPATDLSGNRLQNVPKFTAAAGLSYRMPLENHDIRLSANYMYNDGEFFDVGNTIRQKAYHMLNLRVDADVIEDRMTLSAWMTNAFNETTLRGIAQTGAVNLGSYAPPRLYGVTMSWKL